MEKIWLKSYPPGMQTDVDTSQYRSLVQLLEESFHKYAARNPIAAYLRQSWGQINFAFKQVIIYLSTMQHYLMLLPNHYIIQ